MGSLCKVEDVVAKGPGGWGGDDVVVVVRGLRRIVLNVSMVLCRTLLWVLCLCNMGCV